MTETVNKTKNQSTFFCITQNDTIGQVYTSIKAKF